MCLDVTAMIPPDSPRRVGARRLARESGLRVTKTGTRHERGLHFAVTGPCSCDLLAEQCDLEAPVWTLAPAHLDALCRAVSLLVDEVGRFAFVAYFMGLDRERTSQRVSGPELLEIIRQNQIGNNVLYEVRQPPNEPSGAETG